MYAVQTSTSERVTPNNVKSIIPATAGATQTLDGYERVVLATANTATDDYTLNVAPPSVWAGKHLSIYSSIANSKTVTVGVAGGNPPSWSNLTLDTDDDHVVLFSDGQRIHTVINGIV